MRSIKNISKIFLIVILVLTILNTIFIIKSNAAIVIKPIGYGAYYDINGVSCQETTRQTVTVNQAFNNCRDLGLSTSSLGANSLDPHLSTARDWGAVTYLGLSIYGDIDTDEGSSDDMVIIDNVTYRTTNGNLSGVLNFGNRVNIAAASKKARQPNIVSAHAYAGTSTNNTSQLYKEENQKYVDIVPAIPDNENSKGMGISEIKKWRMRK